MPGEKLKYAIRDYRYLLDRNYPVRSTIKLVGDAHRLTREERSILYRGISGSQAAYLRKSKKTENFKNTNIFIDAFNILFTLSNYLNGRTLFISDDSFLRDAGELRGKMSKDKLHDRTMQLVFDFIWDHKQSNYFFFLDQPVSDSVKLVYKINDFFSVNHLQGNAELCESPDLQIINKAKKDDLVCSSDSIIIESVSSPVYDLSYAILAGRFRDNFIRLSDFIDF